MKKYLFLLLTFLFVMPQFSLVAQTGGADSINTATAFLTADDPKDSEKEETKEDKKKKKKDEEAEFLTFGLERFTLSFFLRLLIDIASMIVLVRFIYYPVYKKRDYFFTFFMFNLTIFVITFLLNTKSGFSMGAAFGLFAVFSLLRYRTEDISARDMTYLFTVISLGLISSVNKGNVMEILVINGIILIAAFILDGNVIMKTEFVKTIQYENIDLIKPDKYDELLADLTERTGLSIHKISIGRVDFMRDTATIKIYYYENKNQDA